MQWLVLNLELQSSHVIERCSNHDSLLSSVDEILVCTLYRSQGRLFSTILIIDIPWGSDGLCTCFCSVHLHDSFQEICGHGFQHWRSLCV